MLDSLDTLIGFALIFAVTSLLITIVVQIVTSLFNLRGQNVAWGLAETFETIAPQLEAQRKGLGKKLADHLLRDSLLSDVQLGSWVRPASAIRPDELFDVLYRIAAGKKEGTPDDIRSSVLELFASLGIERSAFEAAGQKIDRTHEVIRSLTAALDGLPDGSQKSAIFGTLDELNTSLSSLTASAGKQVIDLAADAQQALTGAYQRFEFWFATGQERAHQWFTTHARVVAAIFSLIFAFWLQLDAVEIFKMVSSDRALRDKLVAETSTFLGQAERILGDRPEVLSEALKLWSTNATLPAAVSNAMAVSRIEVAITDHRNHVRRKIADTLQSARISPEDSEAALASFDATVDANVKKDLEASLSDYKVVSAQLGKTGFELFPKGGRRWYPERGDAPYRKHLFGMFCSALLLSLGAPFWFNTLKSLASLRSTLVENISSERKDEKKPGAGSGPHAPPPTIPT